MGGHFVHVAGRPVGARDADVPARADVVEQGRPRRQADDARRRRQARGPQHPVRAGCARDEVADDDAEAPRRHPQAWPRRVVSPAGVRLVHEPGDIGDVGWVGAAAADVGAEAVRWLLLNREGAGRAHGSGLRGGRPGPRSAGYGSSARRGLLRPGSAVSPSWRALTTACAPGGDPRAVGRGRGAWLAWRPNGERTSPSSSQGRASSSVLVATAIGFAVALVGGTPGVNVDMGTRRHGDQAAVVRVDDAVSSWDGDVALCVRRTRRPVVWSGYDPRRGGRRARGARRNRRATRRPRARSRTTPLRQAAATVLAEADAVAADWLSVATASSPRRSVPRRRGRGRARAVAAGAGGRSGRLEARSPAVRWWRAGERRLPSCRPRTAGAVLHVARDGGRRADPAGKAATAVGARGVCGTSTPRGTPYYLRNDATAALRRLNVAFRPVRARPGPRPHVPRLRRRRWRCAGARDGHAGVQDVVAWDPTRDGRAAQAPCEYGWGARSATGSSRTVRRTGGSCVVGHGRTARAGDLALRVPRTARSVLVRTERSRRTGGQGLDGQPAFDRAVGDRSSKTDLHARRADSGRGRRDREQRDQAAGGEQPGARHRGAVCVGQGVQVVDGAAPPGNGQERGDVERPGDARDGVVDADAAPASRSGADAGGRGERHG